jgi:uncharacterized GH25 family protein
MSFRRIVVACTLLVAPALFAHDFWIEPSTYRPAKGEEVVVSLRVGQHFMGDPVPRMSSSIIRFEAIGAKQEMPIDGDEGLAPAGLYELREDGETLLVYESRGTVAELTPEKFAQYVSEEGLEKRIGEPRGGKVRDNFSRCAKTLLRSGSSASKVWSRTIGLPLELIPEHDPYAMKEGSALGVKLLFRGAPLKDALIVAINRRNPGKPVRVWTDANGRAKLPLDRDGAWLVKAVHLLPAADRSRADYDSLWASLSFEIGEGR